MIRASTLLIAYNHEAFIEAALISALRQDVTGHELVIVDDASTDRTRAILEQVLASEAAAGIKVTKIFHDRNLGVLGAINAAMERASGEIFVMMAGDDISAPDRLRRTLGIFDQRPKLQLVYGEMEIIDEHGRLLRPSPVGGVARTFVYTMANWRRIYAGASPCGASAAYRRGLFDFFGPMGPGTHGEDNCYWVRALLLGEIHHDPAMFIQWRQHSHNLSNFSTASCGDWRVRHLDWMSKHVTMSVQWHADIVHARNRGVISRYHAYAACYAATREDTTWGLAIASLRPASWLQWGSAAWKLLRVGRFSTIFRMFNLRLSKKRREKRWQWWLKLKSNSLV